jgi:hypothetical protein
MLPTQPPWRKGEYDVDWLLGLAKLEDAENLQEASDMLSKREKLMVLSHRDGVKRVSQLIAASTGLAEQTAPPEET